MEALENTLITSSKLIGKEIRNREGAKIGQIKDVIFQEGQITSFVVSSGFSLNPLESYVVFPFQNFVKNYDDGIHLIIDSDHRRMESAPKLDSIASHQAVSENLFTNKSGCFAIDDMQLRHLQQHGHFKGTWGDSAPEGDMETSNAYSSNPDHKDSDAHRGPFPPSKDAEGNIEEHGTKDRPMA